MDELTTKRDWEKRWSEKNLIRKIGKHFWFSDIFKNELKNKSYKSFIEIGGYPGNFSIYFKKYWNFSTTLLDFIENYNQIYKLLRFNELQANDINIISSDFLSFKSNKQYDIVFSYGFIEHFSNVKDIISKHWKLVSSGGKLIIIYPNFLGLNGVFQLVFDPDNLVIHNLSIMVIKQLKKQILMSGITNYKIYYYGGLGIWLENLEKRNPILRLFVNFLSATGKFIKLLGINNRYISPHIVLVANK